MRGGGISRAVAANPPAPHPCPLPASGERGAHAERQDALAPRQHLAHPRDEVGLGRGELGALA